MSAERKALFERARDGTDDLHGALGLRPPVTTYVEQ